MPKSKTVVDTNVWISAFCNPFGTPRKIANHFEADKFILVCSNELLAGLAQTRCNLLWPYPAVEYLLGQKTAEELMAEATDNGKMTEAKTYIGVNLLLQGQQQQGLDYLKWVEAHGDKHHFEYKLATAKCVAAMNKHPHIIL